MNTAKIKIMQSGVVLFEGQLEVNSERSLEDTANDLLKVETAINSNTDLRCHVELLKNK